MQRKKVGFDDIHDKYAIRVVIDTGWQGPDEAIEVSNGRQRKKLKKKSEQEARGLCYQVFGIVHGLWQHIPQEFDDYIANPKPNGYQSLHTAVIDDSGQTLEVQIRTDKMHDEAERGIAAHWIYKEESGRPSPSVNKYIKSLCQLLAESQNGQSSEFGDGELLRTEMLSERLFVFTPDGDMVDLPTGSTPIDFAYAIHTQVGHRCRGAKVNDVMVSLDHVLQSGDRIEIITANRGGPSRDWMNANLGYTGNPRTRSKIRQWFRQLERDKNVSQGRDLVERELRRLGLADTFSVEDIAKAMGYDDVEQCLAAAGFGDIQIAQIGGAIAKLRQKLKPDDEILELLNPTPKPAKRLKIQGLDMDGLHTKMAGCCTPIPPEPIIGYITRGHGITIHRSDCKTVLTISEQERILELEWGVEQERYPIPIVVRAYRRRGLTDDINKMLKGRNISAPKTKTLTSQSIITIYMVVEVADLGELDWLLRKMETLTNVLEVKRQRWTD